MAFSHPWGVGVGGEGGFARACGGCSSLYIWPMQAFTGTSRVKSLKAAMVTEAKHLEKVQGTLPRFTIKCTWKYPDLKLDSPSPLLGDFLKGAVTDAEKYPLFYTLWNAAAKSCLDVIFVMHRNIRSLGYAFANDPCASLHRLRGLVGFQVTVDATLKVTREAKCRGAFFRGDARRKRRLLLEGGPERMWLDVDCVLYYVLSSFFQHVRENRGGQPSAERVRGEEAPAFVCPQVASDGNRPMAIVRPLSRSLECL